MTHSITVTSETRLTSTNGDGPQLLTEAATLYAALSALGAVPIVEIVIRTQPEATLSIATASDRYTVETPGPIVAAAPIDIQAPPVAVDPTSPPQTVAGEWEPTPPPLEAVGLRWSEYDALRDQLDRGVTTWRRLTHEQRELLAANVILNLYILLEHAPTMQDFDLSDKPAWLPDAQSIVKLFDQPWTQIVASCRPS